MSELEQEFSALAEERGLGAAVGMFLNLITCEEHRVGVMGGVVADSLMPEEFRGGELVRPLRVGIEPPAFGFDKATTKRIVRALAEVGVTTALVERDGLYAVAVREVRRAG